MAGRDDLEFGDGDEDLSPEEEARIFAPAAEALGAWPPLTAVDEERARLLWEKLLASARDPGPVPYVETIWPEYVEGLFKRLLPQAPEPMAQLQLHAERATILLRCRRM